jgi:hypothetical protein
MEGYDRDRLYPKEFVIRELRIGPKHLRKYINNLPEIPCRNSDGKETTCTRIPEVIYVYLTGRY